MAAAVSDHEMQNQYTLPAGAKPARESSSLTSKMVELHELKEVDESASSELTRPDNPAILSFKGIIKNLAIRTCQFAPAHATCRLQCSRSQLCTCLFAIIDLVVTAKARNQVLLKGISGQIKGGLVAVMGPSGKPDTAVHSLSYSR
jgi:hypothetical protein